LRSFSDTVKLGDLSTLSPAQKLAEARAQFEALSRGASAGNADAASSLPGAASALLAASRLFNSTGAGFSADFDAVQRAVAESAALFGDQQSVAQRHLAVAQGQAISASAAVDSINAQRDAIQEAAAAQIAEIQAAKDNAITDAQRQIDALIATRDAIEKGAADTIARLRETRDAIVLAADEAIAQLVRIEEAAHLARIQQNEYFETFLELLRPSDTERVPLPDTSDAVELARDTLAEQRAANVALQSVVSLQREELDVLRQQVVVMAAAARESNERMDTIIAKLEDGNAAARRSVESALVQ